MRPHRRTTGVWLSLFLALGAARAESLETVPRAAAQGTEPGAAFTRPALVTFPLLRDTVAAALRAAGNAEMRRMLSSMAARSRSSAILPELWLRAARSTDDSLRLSPTVDDPYHYTALGGAGTWLEARLAWHLDRLLFDHDEIAVERLRRQHSEAMGRLVGKVTAVLFAWQRAVVRSEDPKTSSDELEQAVLARTEAEVTLDLLTAGWFGKNVLASSAAASEPTTKGTAP